MWDQVVYLMRYGRQPLGEILRLRTNIATDVQRALSRLVDRENATKKE
jgi:hypothetical protein